MLAYKTPERGFYFFCAAIFGYLLVAPIFKPWAAIGWNDSQRILQIALLVLSAGLFLANTRLAEAMAAVYEHTNLCKRYWLLTALALALLSAQLAILPRMALLEISHNFLLLHAVVVVAACRLALGKIFDQIALATVVFFALFYSTAVLASLFTAYSGVGLDVWALFNGNGFDNPRFFGQAQTLTIPILGALLLVLKKPGHRVALLALLSCWWMFSIAAGMRSTWLGILVALGVAPFIGKSGLAWVRWLLLSLLAGVAFYVLLFYLPNMPQTGTEAVAGSGPQVLINRLPTITHLSAREVIWQQAWELVKSHPLLGIGPMHFALSPNGVGAHPHNALLQWGAEMGLPFTLILLGLLIRGYRHVFRAIRSGIDSASQAVLTGLFLALVAGGAHAMVDGILVMPYSQTLFVLIAGWAIGMSVGMVYGTTTYGSPQRFKVTWIPYALLLIAALSAMLYGVFPEILHLAERESVNVFLAPRFWRLGWLTW
jgi:putative inorganic carbon (hco3(-)) transporter